MKKIITFNRSGYDPFIDFIKAYAIICVLMGHTFPYLDKTGYVLWYGMQVPLFVLVQTFHVFKKTYYKFDIKKCFQRILIPFFIIQIIPLAYVMYNYIHDSNLIIRHITDGGGPGSYYPWLYLQLAVILVYVKPWFEKGSKVQKLFLTLIVCEGLEIIVSLISMPDWLYRLLAIRYFFLIYLGWSWVRDGIVINTKTILLSLLSMATIIYFQYFYTPVEPWFFDTAWRSHRWPCYYYVSTLLCGMLYWLYIKTKDYAIVVRIIKMLAKCSYEIFLLQMVVISFMPAMDFIENPYIRIPLRISLIFAICIIGGYYYSLIYSRLLKRINH